MTGAAAGAGAGAGARTGAAVIGLAMYTLRRLFLGNRAAATLAILAIGPALAAVVTLRSKEVPLDVFHGVVIMIGTHVVPLLLALVHGVGLTTSEIEDGTAQYTLLAALRRPVVALVQTLAAAAAIGALAAAGIGATFAAVHLAAPAAPHAMPEADLALRYAAVAALAVAAYLPPVVACGYGLKHGIAVSVALAVIVEVLPIAMPIRLAAWPLTNAVRGVIIEFVMRGDRGEHLRWNSNWEFPPAATGLERIAIVASVALALAMLAAHRRGLARGDAG